MQEEMTPRCIFHVDVNSAFLSWSALEKLKADPGSVDLRTIPSAVAGDVETRHGIITAKSIPAKKYNVQTGEPVVHALAKCPDLVLVKSDFQAYRHYSSELMKILREYTPFIEKASIDEAYLDVSDSIDSMDGDLKEASVRLAGIIKDDVKKRLGFTVNVGVSVNKFLAKTASDFSKPDKVHTLFPEEIPAKLWPLPIESLHGCGPATSKKLRRIDIQTIGDAAHTKLGALQSLLGTKQGIYVFERVHGNDSSPVHYEVQEAKSYSNETTTGEDVTRENYENYALPILKHLCEKVSQRLKRDAVFGSTISVIVKTGAFQRHTRQTTIGTITNSDTVIFEQSKLLLDMLMLGEGGLFEQGEVLRLIGVGVSKLDKGENRQMDFSDWLFERKQIEAEKANAEKTRRLDSMMNAIRTKYGDGAIHRGNS